MTDVCDWAFLARVTRPALIFTPGTYLDDIQADLIRDGIPDAVARRDSGSIFDRLIGMSQFQGISDANAAAFTTVHGVVGWGEIRSALLEHPACHRLWSYWNFDGCRYQKTKGTCAAPELFGSCSLPQHPARKGALIQAAYALHLFIRDICRGDVVGWVDDQLAAADPGDDASDRGEQMGAALLAPLGNIYGFGAKVWSLALADLLLGADPNRERWVATGAAMIVIDTLVHNHLHRTGTLRRFEAEHAYGPPCYATGGCADIVRGLARQVDAREFNPGYPAYFPRVVQHAIWRFCSEAGHNICNGNRVDDRARCTNVMCPVYPDCDRVGLRPGASLPDRA